MCSVKLKTLSTHFITYCHRGAVPGFARGQTVVSENCEPIAGVWRQSPQWGPWSEPWWVPWALKMKAFFHFYTKEGPKVKDLCDSSPLCLRHTAHSHEQPQLWSSWTGHLLGPPIPGSASDYRPLSFP